MFISKERNSSECFRQSQLMYLPDVKYNTITDLSTVTLRQLYIIHSENVPHSLISDNSILTLYDLGKRRNLVEKC